MEHKYEFTIQSQTLSEGGKIVLVSRVKAQLCIQISLSLLVAGVLSVVLFLVVCVLLYRQTISNQQQADIDQKPVNSLDIILSGEN